MARKRSLTAVTALGKYSLLVLLFALFLTGFYMSTNAKRNSLEQPLQTAAEGNNSETAQGEKTYNNKLFGFSFNYPSAYQIECPECQDDTELDSATHLSFAPPTTEEAAILLDVFSQELSRQSGESLHDYLTRAVGKDYAEFSDPSLTQDLVVGGEEAKQIVLMENGVPSDITTYFVHGTTLYKVDFFDAKTSGKAIFNYPNINDYNKLLSSFTFTQ